MEMKVQMSTYFYQRSPRIITETSSEEIEIYRPSAMPTKPKLNLISIIIPIIVTIGGMGAMVVLSSKMGGAKFLIFQIISMSTMVVSYVIPIIVHFQHIAEYRGDIKKRKRNYEIHLEEKRERLQQLKNEVILNWHQTHPEADFCLKWIKERNQMVWERSPLDRDFLKLRAGIGTVPSGFPMKVPKQEGVEKEPLLEKAIEMTGQYESIANAPALLDLKKYRVVGLVGEVEHLHSFARAIVTQLCTHHSPDEVKLAAFVSHSQSMEWDWIRWLPHIWDDERMFRYLFKESNQRNQILEQLFSTLQRRLWGQQGEPNEHELPYYVRMIRCFPCCLRIPRGLMLPRF
jgi:S-DNA-T family DNA segregation ATPase FtsK/SpoIIIE